MKKDGTRLLDVYGREMYGRIRIDTAYEEEQAMSRILISGLVNVETTCSVERFPIEYEPIHYNFFGVNVVAAGVGYNLAKALTALGDDVDIATMVGKDMASKLVLSELEEVTSGKLVRQRLSQTPASIVLHDKSGARRIY